MTTGKTDAMALKKLARSLVISLVVVVAVVSDYVAFPLGKPTGSNWKFAVTHPTILLHITAAVVTLVLAVILVTRLVRSGEWAWTALSAAGLAFVLLAFGSGDAYVAKLRKSALNYMSAGWVGAIVCYGALWYLGRRQERQRAAAGPIADRSQ